MTIERTHNTDAGEHRRASKIDHQHRASMAACHSGASRSRFGSFVMKVAASSSVISFAAIWQ
jgi:hypothetical protein